MIFRQYFKLFFRHIKVVIITFLIFIALFFVLGSNSNKNNYFEPVKLNLLIENRDNSEISEKFIEYLSKKNDITINTFSENEIDRLIFEKKFDSYILIKENLKENLENNEKPIYTINENNRPKSILLDIEINKFMNYTKSAIKNGNTMNDVISTLNNEIKVNIADISEYNHQTNLETAQTIFGVLGYVLFQLIITVLSNINIIFKNNDLNRRILVAPVSILKNTIQKYFSQIIIGITLTCIFILFLAIRLRYIINEINFGITSIALLVYTITLVALTQVISEIAKDTKTNNTFVSIFSLLIGFSSGVFLPLDFLPNFVLMMAKFFPAYYFVEFLQDININTLFKFTITQGIFILFYMLLSIFIKKQLSKNK